MDNTSPPQPIKANLRALDIGQCVEFPIERVNSVKTTVNQYKTEMARQGWDCNIIIDKNDFIVKVQRTA